MREWEKKLSDTRTYLTMRLKPSDTEWPLHQVKCTIDSNKQSMTWIQLCSFRHSEVQNKVEGEHQTEEDFEWIVCSRLVGLKISSSADLLGFSQPAVSGVSRKHSKKEKNPSEQKWGGRYGLDIRENPVIFSLKTRMDGRTLPGAFTAFSYCSFKEI